MSLRRWFPTGKFTSCRVHPVRGSVFTNLDVILTGVNKFFPRDVATATALKRALVAHGEITSTFDMAEVTIKKLCEIDAFKLFLRDVGRAHPSPHQVAREMWHEPNEHFPKVRNFCLFVSLVVDVQRGAEILQAKLGMQNKHDKSKLNLTTMSVVVSCDHFDAKIVKAVDLTVDRVFFRQLSLLGSAEILLDTFLLWRQFVKGNKR